MTEVPGRQRARGAPVCDEVRSYPPAMKAARRPSRTRSALFAGLLTASALAAIVGGAELVDRIAPVTMKQEDVVVHVVEPLLERRGDGFETSWYAEINSASGRISADPRAGWRAVALGGSFLFGDPYGESGQPEAPGGLLYWLGEALGPDAELLNLAGLGDTSDRVATKARVAAALQPDVLIVATGNNEYPIPPPSAARAQRRRLGFVRAVSLLREPGRGLVEDLEAVYASGPPEAELRARYRTNLEAIAGAAAEHGVPVLLATLPNNLLHELVGEGGAWNEAEVECVATLAEALARSDAPLAQWVEGLVDRSASSCATGVLRQWDAGHASDALRQAVPCPEAESFGPVGAALAVRGRVDDAVPLLELRAETRPWLVRPSFNREVRAVAAAHEHVHLADLQAALLARARPAPSAPGFVDSCHLHWSGYADAAQDLLDALDRAGLNPRPGARVVADDAHAAELGLPPRPGPVAELPTAPDRWTCPPAVPMLPRIP